MNPYSSLTAETNPTVRMFNKYRDVVSLSNSTD